MHACASVFARVRAHACVFMRGCVCAYVFSPTRVRVYACLCTRVRVRQVHERMHSRADAHARMCTCLQE